MPLFKMRDLEWHAMQDGSGTVALCGAKITSGVVIVNRKCPEFTCEDCKSVLEQQRQAIDNNTRDLRGGT